MSKPLHQMEKLNEWNNSTVIHEIYNYYTNCFKDNEWK